MNIRGFITEGIPMKMNLCKSLAAVTVLGGVLAAPQTLAFDAVSVNVAPAAKSGGFVGLGVGFAPDYEGSDDHEAIPAPFGSYQWASGRFVELGGTQGAEHAARLSANIISSDWSSGWKAGPLVQYRLERDSVDNKQVDKMENVDAATELGAFAGFKTGAWSGQLAFAGDVSDEHDGYLVYLKGVYELPVNDRFILDFGAGTSYADSNYMEAYFGVDNKNRGSSGLPDYKPDSGIKDVELTLTGLYQFNDAWGMVGSVSWTRMLNDAEDSPLVDGNGGVGDENQFGGVLAVTYSLLSGAGFGC
jgi:outer membrane protein